MKGDPPVASFREFQLQDNDTFDRHRKRLHSVKHFIDVGVPKGYSEQLRKVRSKKDALREDRLVSIQHDNSILLKKMNAIHSKNKGDYATKKDDPALRAIKSLNALGRKRYLNSIMADNAKLLMRIMGNRSTQLKEWKEHAIRHDRLIQSMAGRKVRPIRSSSTVHLPPLLKHTNKKEPVVLLQVSRTMSGAQCEVSVVEVVEPKHNFVLQAYDPQRGESAEICIPFRVIMQLWPAKDANSSIFDPSNRATLASMLVAQLDLEDSQLIFKRPSVTLAKPSHDGLLKMHASSSVDSLPSSSLSSENETKEDTLDSSSMHSARVGADVWIRAIATGAVKVRVSCRSLPSETKDGRDVNPLVVLWRKDPLLGTYTNCRCSEAVAGSVNPDFSETFSLSTEGVEKGSDESGKSNVEDVMFKFTIYSVDMMSDKPIVDEDLLCSGKLKLGDFLTQTEGAFEIALTNRNGSAVKGADGKPSTLIVTVPNRKSPKQGRAAVGVSLSSSASASTLSAHSSVSSSSSLSLAASHKNVKSGNNVLSVGGTRSAADGAAVCLSVANLPMPTDPLANQIIVVLWQKHLRTGAYSHAGHAPITQTMLLPVYPNVPASEVENLVYKFSIYATKEGAAVTDANFIASAKLRLGNFLISQAGVTLPLKNRAQEDVVAGMGGSLATLKVRRARAGDAFAAADDDNDIDEDLDSGDSTLKLAISSSTQSLHSTSSRKSLSLGATMPNMNTSPQRQGKLQGSKGGANGATTAGIGKGQLSQTARRDSLQTQQVDEKKQKINVIFLIGAPGSGKGSHGHRLAQAMKFAHIPVIHTEHTKTDTLLMQINHDMDIKKAHGHHTVLISGFPESSDQLSAWDSMMREKASIKLVVHFNVPKSEHETRMEQLEAERASMVESVPSAHKLDMGARGVAHFKLTHLLSVFEKKGLLRKLNTNLPFQQVGDILMKCVAPIIKPLPSVILVAGVPLSGKSTHAQYLAETYAAVPINMLAVVKDEIKNIGEFSAELNKTWQENKGMSLAGMAHKTLAELLKRKILETEKRLMRQADAASFGLQKRRGKYRPSMYVIDDFLVEPAHLEAFHATSYGSIILQYITFFDCPLEVVEFRHSSASASSLSSKTGGDKDNEDKSTLALQYQAACDLLDSDAVKDEGSVLVKMETVNGAHAVQIAMTNMLFNYGMPLIDASTVQTTFAFIKPDIMRRSGMREAVVTKIKDAGFEIVRSKELALVPEMAGHMYRQHMGNVFYERLVKFMCSEPVLALMLRRKGAVGEWKKVMGPTDPDQARCLAPHSLRALFGTDVMMNAVHGSDSIFSANKEMKYIFNKSVVPKDLNVVKGNHGSLGGKRIILTGGPCSGKRTQAFLLKELVGSVYISTKDLIKAEKSTASEMAKKIADATEKAVAVPDEVIVELVKQRIAKEDVKERGYLLDGFPRNKAQAEVMVKEKILPDLFINIVVSKDKLVERIVGRSEDPKTGIVYHDKFKPPPPGVFVVRRNDDSEESALRKIKRHQQRVDEVKAFFATKAVAVNGDASIAHCFREIMDFLN